MQPKFLEANHFVRNNSLCFIVLSSGKSCFNGFQLPRRTFCSQVILNAGIAAWTEHKAGDALDPRRPVKGPWWDINRFMDLGKIIQWRSIDDFPVFHDYQISRYFMKALPKTPDLKQLEAVACWPRFKITIWVLKGSRWRHGNQHGYWTSPFLNMFDRNPYNKMFISVSMFKWKHI